MRLIAALSENIVTASMLLSVIFLPGVLAVCNNVNPSFSITTPNQNEALNGSCLHVPCSFKALSGFNIHGNVFGVWIKSDKNIYETEQGVNKYPLEITGDLNQYNCTTLFSDVNTNVQGLYFLRLYNGNLKATACADPLSVNVRDYPWSPSVNISAGDLKEHQSVTVTCSAFTPCPQSPPELTWNLQQDSLNQTEKNTDGPFTTKIQETITLSDTHDGYNISCSARYPVIGGNKTAETEVTLSVSYAPRNTSASISPSGLVSAGSRVELSCSSRAKPPPSFTWFRNSKDGATNVSVGQVYSFNASEEGEFHCVASNDLGQTNSSVILLSIKGNLKFLCPLLALIVFPVLISLLISVWCFKSKRSTPQKTQSQTGEEVHAEKGANKPEEELQYVDINFFKRTPEAPSDSVQESGQLETVYAQVKAPDTGNRKYSVD
ncbi:B-cell receptor CD22-like isoform X1 [Xiphophorus maculatus]|uniref:B-cell receptor CD22-like isoform X1 n=1 Tax=Xiphophorus maculatus TaxID=8083 RepID=UPI000C6CB72A|nr:B-cell receptor CD22-like isoform X1 [Xiphophorus maculatus]